MFLDSIALTRTIPCLAEPGKIIVYGRPSCSLDEVLPFLANLPSVLAYNPDMHTLTFRREVGFITLYSDRIFITQVRDAMEGLELLDALKEAINVTWEHRNELQAVRAARRVPRPLDIWPLLPKTNCKKCGEETCMAFACNLLLQKRNLTECKPLWDEAVFTDRRITLETMV
jgi:ArsR family metal-binding transcriptional regulator